MPAPLADAPYPGDSASTRLARERYGPLRDHLRSDVVGHASVVDRLALAGAQHAAGIPSRLVLAGPPGVGKTTMVRSLAQALRSPYALVDVTEIAETNWSGLQLADVLSDLYLQAGASIAAMDRSVIVLDELDKLTMRGASGISRDYQRGRQRSLLALLGGGVPLRFGVAGERDRSLQWRSDAALIIGTGVFDGLPDSRDPAPKDLVRLGFMPELVERFGELIRLRALGAMELVSVLERRLDTARAAYEEFGYRLEVAPAAINAIAGAVGRGRGRPGPRTAATWLIAAAQRGLTTLLNAGAAAGASWQLTPDDVAPHLGGGSASLGR